MNTCRADGKDVEYAYRLLLGRKPDPAGYETFLSLIREQPLRPVELARYFLGSPEFLALHRADIQEVALDGYVIAVRSDDFDVGKSVSTALCWEPHVVSALENHLQPGGRFLDVGANIGYFTAWAAHRVGTNGRVVAVEPMEKNLQLIYTTIERNGFANVSVEPFGASSRNAIVCMSTHEHSSNGEILTKWVRGTRPYYVQVRRLDELLSAEERFDVVKLDIEGHEPLAWRGMQQRLHTDRPVVVTEFHPKCLRDNTQVDPSDFAATLLGYGRVIVLGTDGQRYPCLDVERLLNHWEREDEILRTNGGAHLDLLVEPHS